MDLQLCRHLKGNRFDILFGRDEILLCGLALGCTGAVGSTYNYLTPLYLDLWDAFSRNELQRANELQLLSMRLVQTMFQYGNPIVCGKALMQMLGVDCGNVRPPLKPLSRAALEALRHDLEKLGAWSYCNPVAERTISLPS